MAGPATLVVGLFCILAGSAMANLPQASYSSKPEYDRLCAIGENAQCPVGLLSSVSVGGCDNAGNGCKNLIWDSFDDIAAGKCCCCPGAKTPIPTNSPVSPPLPGPGPTPLPTPLTPPIPTQGPATPISPGIPPTSPASPPPSPGPGPRGASPPANSPVSPPTQVQTPPAQAPTSPPASPPQSSVPPPSSPRAPVPPPLQPPPPQPDCSYQPCAVISRQFLYTDSAPDNLVFSCPDDAKAYCTGTIGGSLLNACKATSDCENFQDGAGGYCSLGVAGEPDNNPGNGCIADSDCDVGYFCSYYGAPSGGGTCVTLTPQSCFVPGGDK